MYRALIFALAFWVGWSNHVFAHDWYDPACCSGQDCAPVAAHVVRSTPEGWLIEVDVGDHPLATGPFQTIVPYGHRRERISQDEDFHVCLRPGGQHLYCVYVPHVGF